MSRRRVTVLLFEDFEALDVFGPVELFSHVPGWTVEYAGPDAEPVATSQGTAVLTTRRWQELTAGTDILLVPGGRGTRVLAEDADFLPMLRGVAEEAHLLASVCTGSALLAAAGLLEGREATSNKRAFAWASAFGDRVRWRRRARWTRDGRIWTSSGVVAGMDMAAALIRAEEGDETARELLRAVELEVQTDPTRDPFAG